MIPTDIRPLLRIIQAMYESFTTFDQGMITKEQLARDIGEYMTQAKALPTPDAEA